MQFIYASADAERYFKAGAQAYVRALHEAGVRLGVATASAPELFLPVLEAGGIRELFSAVRTICCVLAFLLIFLHSTTTVRAEYCFL